MLMKSSLDAYGAAQSCLSSPISFCGAAELPKAGIVGTSLMDGCVVLLGNVVHYQRSQVYRGYIFFFIKELKVIQNKIKPQK